LLSNVARWLQDITIPYILYQLTGSGAMIGVAAFLRFSPSIVIGPYSGAIADRFHRKTVLLISQVGLAIVAAALWAAWVLDFRNTAVLIVLTTMGGVINALNTPTWQTFIPELVPRELLAGGVALTEERTRGRSARAGAGRGDHGHRLLLGDDAAHGDAQRLERGTGQGAVDPLAGVASAAAAGSNDFELLGGADEGQEQSGAGLEDRVVGGHGSQPVLDLVPRARIQVVEAGGDQVPRAPPGVPAEASVHVGEDRGQLRALLGDDPGGCDQGRGVQWAVRELELRHQQTGQTGVECVPDPDGRAAGPGPDGDEGQLLGQQQGLTVAHVMSRATVRRVPAYANASP
jgi:hypothetical protein